MTLILDLPPHLESALRDAAEARGMDVNAYAVAVLERTVTDPAATAGEDEAAVFAWWTGLTEAGREAERAKTAASLAAADAGRRSLAPDVYARLRSRFAIPDATAPSADDLRRLEAVRSLAALGRELNLAPLPSGQMRRASLHKGGLGGRVTAE